MFGKVYVDVLLSSSKFWLREPYIIFLTSLIIHFNQLDKLIKAKFDSFLIWIRQ